MKLQVERARGVGIVHFSIQMAFSLPYLLEAIFCAGKWRVRCLQIREMQEGPRPDLPAVDLITQLLFKHLEVNLPIPTLETKVSVGS